MKLFKGPRAENITSVDGEKISFRTVGDSKDPPVVFLHGLSMESRLLLPLCWPFSEEYFFILPDLRGFGKSSHFVRDPEDILSTMCSDLDSVLDSLGVKKAKFVGISYGTLVIMKYLETRPDKIKDILFIDHSMKPLSTPDRNTGPCYQAQAQGNFLDIVELFRAEMGTYRNGKWSYRRDSNFENMSKTFRDTYESLSKETIISGLSPQISFPLHLSQNSIFRSMNPLFKCWYMTMLILASYIENQYDFKRLLRDTKIPYDIFWGKTTRMFHPDAIQDYKDIQGSNSGRIVLFEGGHDLFYTDYADFVKEFRIFLNR